MKFAEPSRNVLGVLFLVFVLGFFSCSQKEARPYLDRALDAARWIEGSTVDTERGFMWPAVPAEADTNNNWLYSGNSGVVLFFLEAYYSTGDIKYLDLAGSGADYLLEGIVREKFPGLYTGISGIGFTLYETFMATREKKYFEGFKKCCQFLKDTAKENGQGIEWSTTTDIISGTAGTGLFLIYAYSKTKDESLLNLAVSAGKRLTELGQPVEGGIKWAMDPNYPRLMPNFSHGTAGIAYFLTSLYKETKQKEFLDAAISGANYLKAVAATEGDGCLIFHHEPDGEDLFYLGWCHGPVGTSRLFYRLFVLTEDNSWMDWVEKGAKAILKSGIPEEEHDGFWNNVGVCCGSAGVADYFLSLFKVTQRIEYLDFAQKLTENLLSRATKGETGIRWVQAEHRSRPDFLQAQTGLMQGAAGIGLWLLRLDAHEQGLSPRINFPDTPFD